MDADLTPEPFGCCGAVEDEEPGTPDVYKHQTYTCARAPRLQSNATQLMPAAADLAQTVLHGEVRRDFTLADDIRILRECVGSLPTRSEMPRTSSINTPANIGPKRSARSQPFLFSCPNIPEFGTLGQPGIFMNRGMKRPTEEEQDACHEQKRTRSAHRGMHTKRHHDGADDSSREKSDDTGLSGWASAAVYSNSAYISTAIVHEPFVLDETFQHMNSCIIEAVAHARPAQDGGPLQADGGDHPSAYCHEGNALTDLTSVHLNNQQCARAQASTHVRAEQLPVYTRTTTPTELSWRSIINTQSFHSKMNLSQSGTHPDEDCSGDAPTGPAQVNFHDGPAPLTSSDSGAFVHTEPTCVCSDEGCFTAEPGMCYLGKRVAEESLKEKELLERLGDLHIMIAANVRGERGSGKRCKTTTMEEQNVGSAWR